MIKVCDAIMGSGKTSAAISYMNEHPNQRYLYITPYLEETKRVQEQCPDLNFVLPNNYTTSSHSKVSHTKFLLEDGRNIASTHSAINLYDDSILSDLEENNYTIIIDEAINVIRKVDYLNAEDIYAFADAGYMEEIYPNEYARTDKVCKCKYLSGPLRNLSMSTVSITPAKSDSGSGGVCRTIFSQDFFNLPNDMIVLTYMFADSPMELLLRMNNIDYTYIGVELRDDGTYHFSKPCAYIPEYVKELPNKIHILDHKKMNCVGEDRCALSIHWYDTKPDEVQALRKHLTNWFHNIHGNDDKAYYMCGTYKNHWNQIKGPGYGRSNVVFNERATNDYSDRYVLAYPVNIFINPDTKRYFSSRGVTLNDDVYATSTMIQWIWRSAIRNGHEIWIYLPSRRMRTLFQDWLETLIECEPERG